MAEPVWKNDIEDLFTPTDIDHMRTRGVVLGSYEYVKTNFSLVLSRIEDNSMPPGNPWPPDWRTRFKEWAAAGFPEG